MIYGSYDEFFYRDCSQVYFDNMVLNNSFKTRRAPNLYDFNEIFVKEGLKGHISDMVKKVLRLEDDFSPYKHEDILRERIESAVSSEDKEYIDEITSNKKIVGFQYFTGMKKGQVVMSDPARNWKKEVTEEFIELCREKGIALLALNPNLNETKLNIPQLRSMSFQAYAYAISKLSLLVGIDSSGGHIASLYNVPSITIWGKQSPVDWRGQPISWRAMRRNYSLWADDGDINKVRPEIVVDKILEYQNGMLEISDQLISYEDSLNYKQIEIIKTSD